MVSPSKSSKYSRVADPNKVKLVRGTKPLFYFKFYLDIENHSVAEKIESKIKELGGSIEFFLNKDITHFVTDKSLPKVNNHVLPSEIPSTNLGYSTSKPASASVNFSKDLPSSSPKLNSSNDFKASSGKQISRADFLLQKARQQHQKVNELQVTNTKLNHTSPIQVAEESNVIIWTTNYTIRYLEKINNSLQYLSGSAVATGSNNGNRYRSKNVKHLKGDFVKIESFQKNYRPFYKEFKKWPTLNFNARLTNSPFDTKSDCDKKLKKSSKLFFSKVDSRTTAVTTTNNTVADNTVNSESDGGNFDRMTRKARNAKIIKCSKNNAVKDNSNVSTHFEDDCYEQNKKQCGYCEICRVEYDVLKVHLKTDEHLNFIRNDTNFMSLDNLISSGANLETFLKLNSEPLTKSETIFLESKSLHKKHSSSTNKGMKKVANKSVTRDSEMRELLETQEKLLNGYAELNDLKLSRNLRSTFTTTDNVKTTKSEKSKPKNRRPTVDDEDIEGASQCKSIRLRRQSTTMRRINYVEPKDTVVEYESDEELEVSTAKPKVDKSKIKLYGVRWRAPRASSQEKSANVVKSTPLVYKVIEDKPKSSTSTVTRKNYVEPSATNDKNSDLSGSLIVKFKRLRQSELNLLNNEAENFMFPQKKENENEDDHTGTDTDEDRHTTSERTAGQSFTIPSSDQEPLSSTKKHRNDTMERLLLADVTSSCCRTRRRRNQLEAFLNDNNDYYKFEETESRLRFQEDQTATASTAINKDCKIDNKLVVSESPEDALEENQAAANKKKKWHLIEDLNSESVKQQTFSFERIPSSEPWYDAFYRQDHGVQRVYSYFGNTAYRKLPFEIGPLPPLPPNCCKNPPEESVIPPGEVSSTTVASQSCSIVTKEANTFKNKITTNDSQINRRIAASIVGLKRKQMLIDLDKPRKSPREHASTLAILSSLIHQRKKRDSIGTEMANGETSSSSNNCMTRLSETLLNNDDTTNSSNSNMSSCHTDAVGKSSGRVTRAASRPKMGKSKKMTRKNSANDESSVYSVSSGTILNQEDNIYTSAMCTLKRQVDNLLNNAFLDDDIDNMSIDIKFDEVDEDPIRTSEGQLQRSNLMEIDLNDLKKDFVELLSSDLSNEPFTIGATAKKEIQIRRRVQYDIRMCRPMGPFPPDLRYSMCAKKRANRTGWPNAVKRKIVTRKVKKSVDEEAAAVSLDEENIASGDGDAVFKDEEDEEDSILTADVEDDLQSQTKSDGRISTEIFVVSSDTQSVTENVTNKTDIDNLSTKSVYEDAVSDLTDFVPDIADVVKNRRKTQQNPKYFSSQYTNSLSPSKKPSPNEKTASIKNSISTRSGPLLPDKRKTTTPKKLSFSPSHNRTPVASTTANQNNNNNQAISPPSPKYSPRKLRKPRGRWYRER